MTAQDPKFTWEDIIVDNVTPDEAAAWSVDWAWFLSGQFYPVFLSRFGNWFLRRPDGSTQFFEINEGTIVTIAATPEEFQACVNTVEWQERYLYSALVMKYRRQGVVARGRDGIAFVPHPSFVASIDACKVMVMSMNVLQSLSGQSMRQMRVGS
jgi:hypothetical protein